MSALGQKRTYAAQQAMSALLATAKVDSRKRSCLLWAKSGRGYKLVLAPIHLASQISSQRSRGACQYFRLPDKCGEVA